MWLQFVPIEGTMAAGSTALVLFSLNTAALNLAPFTVVRTRGVFGLRSDQISAPEAYSASLGIAVVSEQAAAIGATAVPTPETDRGSGLFFVYESLAGSFAFTTGAGYIESGKWMSFDSKAMRKLEQGNDIVVVVETSAISNAAIAHVSLRMLVKLN